MRLKAIIFDVDGTLAETEEAHRTAFNQSFAEAGLSWHWSEDDYRELLTTTGGRERIARYMAEQSLSPDAASVMAIHLRKNAIYGELVAQGVVTPRPGVVRLIEEARARDVALAIATTTSRANLVALLIHAFDAEALSWFQAVVTGDDVIRKKPDPEVYHQVLAVLSLDSSSCVAIEDSRNGVEAALAAGIATVATPSRYAANECFQGAMLTAADLSGEDGIVGIDALERALSRSS